MRAMEEVEEPIVSRWVKTMPSKASVVAKVDDWIQRLNALYDQMDEWCEGIEDLETERGSRLQLPEYWMTKFHVAPRNVPTYTIFLANRKKKIRFFPDVIWIVGANGRVDVIMKPRSESLVDEGGDGKPSDWKVVLYSDRVPVKTFDRNLFLKWLQRAK